METLRIYEIEHSGSDESVYVQASSMEEAISKFHQYWQDKYSPEPTTQKIALWFEQEVIM